MAHPAAGSFLLGTQKEVEEKIPFCVPNKKENMLDLFSDYYNSSAEDLASFMERLEKEAREIDETSDVILEAEEEQSLQHGERTGQNKQWPEEAVLEKTPEGLPLPSLARNVSATAEDERDILT